MNQRSDDHRRGLGGPWPVVFLIFVWAGAYFAWRTVHAERDAQGQVARIVYPDTRAGRLAYDVFSPLRRLDAHYLGVTSRYDRASLVAPVQTRVEPPESPGSVP